MKNGDFLDGINDCLNGKKLDATGSEQYARGYRSEFYRSIGSASGSKAK